MDGQITVLAGTTFTEFVERHRRELVRVIALVGGDLPAAVEAVDAALKRAERKWDAIDGDPSAWTLTRALRDLDLPETAEPPAGLAQLPTAERLDAVLYHYLQWRPQHRVAVGATATGHPEQYAAAIDDALAALGTIPPRVIRAPRRGLRLAGIAVAVAAGAAALIVAGNVGGPEPLATIPTLSPLEQPEAVEQDRPARLLPAAQIEWTTPLGVRARQFVQVGATTFGYTQTANGLRAWSTATGVLWTDHGIVLETGGQLAQITEGGPGVIAVVRAADGSLTGVTLFTSPNGIDFEEAPSDLIAEASFVHIVGSSREVTVISLWKDLTRPWNEEVLSRLDPLERATADEFGHWTEGTDIVVGGPLFGPARRVSLRELGLDPADAPRPPGGEESVWYSADLVNWTAIDDPLDVIGFFGETVVGTAMPGGEVAIPARGSTTRYVVVDAENGTTPLSSNRLVDHLRPFGGDIVGVSGAYPVSQIVRSTDLVEWVELSPTLAGAIESNPNRVELASGELGLLAAFTRFSWGDAETVTNRVEFDGFELEANAAAGLEISRDGEVVANIISMQDERLMIHDLRRRTITILHPTTTEPIVTIPFELATELLPTVGFGIDESVQLVFTSDGVEWSIEVPPFYDGGPVSMTDFHVGTHMLVLAADETSPSGAVTHVIVGHLREPTRSVPAR